MRDMDAQIGDCPHCADPVRLFSSYPGVANSPNSMPVPLQVLARFLEITRKGPSAENAVGMGERARVPTLRGLCESRYTLEGAGSQRSGTYGRRRRVVPHRADRIAALWILLKKSRLSAGQGIGQPALLQTELSCQVWGICRCWNRMTLWCVAGHTLSPQDYISTAEPACVLRRMERT